jgi:hypothetical protein
MTSFEDKDGSPRSLLYIWSSWRNAVVKNLLDAIGASFHPLGAQVDDPKSISRKK